MKRVLFVDDEANILEGLRRSLRCMRSEWEMEFACGPTQALKTLGASAFDVVVSDMRMPEMDGAVLLSKVMRDHPGTIRLILSGHADPAAIMKSVGVTHQFLSKPCDVAFLKETIERACSLRQLVESPSVRAAVAGIDSLPTLPSLYRELVACLQSEHATTDAVARLIAGDIGMTTRILQLVNSAFFGLGRSVTTIDRAVAYLGLDTIGSLVLAHGMFAEYDDCAVPGLDVAAVKDHALRVGAIAQAIARAEGADRTTVEQALLAGMLQDVGTLVLAVAFPEKFTAYAARRQGSPSDVRLEAEIFGASHAAVGAYLLGLWGLPSPIVEAVAYHEEPSACVAPTFGVFGMLHVAVRIADQPLIEDPSDPQLRLDLAYLSRAEALGRWPVWRDALRSAALLST